MDEFLIAHEPGLRLGAFLGVLLLMLIWERWRPRRQAAAPRPRRWLSNFGLVLVNTLALRLLVPLLAVGAAAVARQNGWGLFNLMELPVWLAMGLTVLALDLAIYGQHVLMHRLPLLWRLHRMHHSDVDFDASTGLRFHPLEIVISMLYKMALVVAVGAPPAAVILFEVILNATSLFNHGNVSLPPSWEARVRALIVTPDMHRVHHSVLREETDSNFGFNLSVWDRLFGTYRAQPAAGHDRMRIGLTRFREPRFLKLRWLLAQPFLNDRKRHT